MPRAPWSHNSLIALTLVGRAQGQRVINVHHFELSQVVEALMITDALAQNQGAVIAADWIANLRAAFLFMLPTDYFLDAVRAQVLERPGLLDHKLVAVEDLTGAPAPGTSGAVTDDMSTSAVVRWRSPLAGKRHRGRNYFGPWDDSAVNAGVFQPNTLARINAYRDGMISRYTGAGAGVVGTGATFTIYSRPYDTGKYQYTRRIGGVLTVITPPFYNGDSTFIQSGVTDTTARVQRRRELGVGA